MKKGVLTKYHKGLEEEEQISSSSNWNTTWQWSFEKPDGGGLVAPNEFSPSESTLLKAFYKRENSSLILTNVFLVDYFLTCKPQQNFDNL